MEVKAIRDFALLFKNQGAVSTGWNYDYMNGVKVLASKWTYKPPFSLLEKVLDKMVLYEQEKNSAFSDEHNFSAEVYQLGDTWAQEAVNDLVTSLGHPIANQHNLAFAVASEGSLEQEVFKVKVAFYPMTK